MKDLKKIEFYWFVILRKYYHVLYMLHKKTLSKMTLLFPNSSWWVQLWLNLTGLWHHISTVTCYICYTKDSLQNDITFFKIVHDKFNSVHNFLGQRVNLIGLETTLSMDRPSAHISLLITGIWVGPIDQTNVWWALMAVALWFFTRAAPRCPTRHSHTSLIGPTWRNPRAQKKIKKLKIKIEISRKDLVENLT